MKVEAQASSVAPKQGGHKADAPIKSATLSPLLVLLSAPSGGGKTTLCQQLLAARPDMARAITCTTREPRIGERDGVDYYFLDAGSFLKRVQAGNFLEHATVYGQSYGTLKSEVLSKLRDGKDVLLNVDVQGAAAIRARTEEDAELKRALVSVFLTPPSLTVLEARLKKRGTDSTTNIQKRLSVARQEIGQWKNFDYLIISDSIGADLRRMQAIIEAEKMRSARAVAPEL
ncbi:MAG TPA: guanylate kinase [Verrucomicrobiae bacterium]|nr:guanylate kinase [Verrucomicrobiae bacterium]